MLTSSSYLSPDWLASTGVGLFLGLAIGLFLGRLHMYKNFHGHICECCRKEMSFSKHADDENEPYLDESYQILEGAIRLFSQRWLDERQANLPLGRTPDTKRVVHYLKPKIMLQKLFHDDEKNQSSPSFSLKNSIVPKSKAQVNAKAMIELLSNIQKYSVDTSHPYFFNQLFGATDPIALAAELVALSVNTSAYTYETAPIFTLIEREVISNIAKVVYGRDSSLTYDGMMMPGGSLSNLTALHIARHWFMSKLSKSSDRDVKFYKGRIQVDSEEKKDSFYGEPSPQLVAFVSEEAHYSFLKAADVIGLGRENLIPIPTLSNGVMDTKYLDTAIRTAKAQYKFPFFIGATSGSTVRGSFDAIDEIVMTCDENGGGIWIHVDGAWGGPAIFSSSEKIRKLMQGVERADSFTFNPHKMLGAPQQTTVFISRHENILKSSNSLRAKYLFDGRKNGAEYDIGDALYTCGRRTDAVKIWAMLKFYGVCGLGKQVDRKVESLQYFAKRVRQHSSFMCACDPWPFNVNFFYLPKRIRKMLDEAGISTNELNPILPHNISDELANVTVKLKLLMHEAGEMLIPYQPISNQRADCFRLVLAGQKEFTKRDVDHILSVMEKYGEDL